MAVTINENMDLRSWYLGGIPDGSPILKNESDPSKKLRFELEKLSTATTRVWTVPDADLNFAPGPLDEPGLGTPDAIIYSLPGAWRTPDVVEILTAANQKWIRFMDEAGTSEIGHFRDNSGKLALVAGSLNLGPSVSSGLEIGSSGLESSSTLVGNPGGRFFTQYAGTQRGFVAKVSAGASGRAIQVLNDADAELFYVDASGNVFIAGNFTVNGTTTTVNSTTVTIDDPIFTLGGDTAPTVDDNKDRGIEFRWHNGSAAKVGFFGFDDSTGFFTFIPDATNTSEVFTGDAGIIANNLSGYLVVATDAINDSTYTDPLTDTVFDVDDGTKFIKGDTIQVDGSDEIMRVTNVSSNTLTVTRGFGGTTPEALADNQVLRVVFIGGLNATMYVLGGRNEIDGDEIDIDFTPSEYTPATGTPGTNVDHLAAHLRGIDNALSGVGASFGTVTAVLDDNNAVVFLPATDSDADRATALKTAWDTYPGAAIYISAGTFDFTSLATKYLGSRTGSLHGVGVGVSIVKTSVNDASDVTPLLSNGSGSLAVSGVTLQNDNTDFGTVLRSGTGSLFLDDVELKGGGRLYERGGAGTVHAHNVRLNPTGATSAAGYFSSITGVAGTERWDSMTFTAVQAGTIPVYLRSGTFTFTDIFVESNFGSNRTVDVQGATVLLLNGYVNNLSGTSPVDVGVSTGSATAHRVKGGGTGGALRTSGGVGIENAVRQVLTAKGRLITHDGSDPVALTPGSDGQKLLADSTVAAGLKYVDDHTYPTMTLLKDASGPSELTIDDGQLGYWGLPNGSTKGVKAIKAVPANVFYANANPTIDCSVIVSAAGTGNGVVRFRATMRYVGEGELLSKAADETLTVDVSVTNTLLSKHALTITLNKSLLAVGDAIYLHLERLGGDAADTFDGEVAVPKQASIRVPVA